MADYTVISSSPTPPNATTSILSSPCLPSLDMLVNKSSEPQPDRNASPIPNVAKSRFACTATLLRSHEGAENIQTFKASCLEPRPSSTTEALSIGTDYMQQKLKTKMVKKASNAVPVQKQAPARKPRAKRADATTDQVSIARKPRARKSIEAGQPKMLNAKVTKPSTLKADSAKPARRTKVTKTAKTSHDFEFVQEVGSTRTDLLGEVAVQPFAVARRREWTPPRAASKVVGKGNTPVPFDLTTPSTREESAMKAEGFKDLLGNFSFHEAKNGTVRPSWEAVSVRKRKLVELVKTNAPDLQEPVLKVKAVKKKPLTITGMAVEAYSSNDGDGQGSHLLQYFPPRNSALEPSTISNNGSKSRSRSPTKRSTMTSVPKSTLLSPESALKHVTKQQFVFGTSSQLAKDESPSFLRQLHTVMQLSNCSDSQNSTKEPSTPSKKPTSLWTAGARGIDGELFEIETFDLTRTPAPAKSHATQHVLAVDESSAILTNTGLIDNDQHVVITDESRPEGLPISSVPVVGPVEASIREKLLSSPGIAELASVEATSKVNKRTKKNTKKDEKPNYELYTTAQLTKEIKSYHFKPIKSRDGMISLLEKCWAGKRQLALGNLGTNSVLQTTPTKSSAAKTGGSSVGSPTKPRGRPRKKSVATKTLEDANAFREISDSDTPLAKLLTPERRRKLKKSRKEATEEISDSDSPMTPSPPRRRASLIGTPPLPLELTIESELGTSIASPTVEQAVLHKHITSALKQCPRSSNPKNPSWLEKIQLFDPIVLEDLTIWLNTGALEKAGWDGEVTPLEVKRWCLEKSICCLWRENLRGGSRARY